ncbi:sodium/proton antiporter (plasmid) [Peptoclostridium acidaminophilum DSM 3953]|uniref:Sodium/proton antiporter n=1 Tax=Peptoclostridium acidaminophilum DSM 3953 TaxID=1286171 RepID=W8UAK1_PEPAC|nr:cation:proton antiporter subunit C [Peptoclostridium acidaminophilum]AHM57826.1 sodium/proton antiporter [Peptoclostridium acidaminophilum DSM 3953]
MERLITNYVEVCAIVLFGVGFMTLLMHNNMIKKIIGLNIMDTAVFLFFIAKGYISGKQAPIVVGKLEQASAYINPVPTALMLTGIVVAVSTTALALALTVRLHEKYGTIELDEIIRMREA